MGKLSVTRDFDISAEEIWAVVSDPNQYGDWLTLHVKWKSEVPSELSAGVQMTEVVRLMGMPNTVVWTVDEYEAPSKVAISGTGMAGVKVALTLTATPKADGASFALSAEFNGQMLVGALGKAVEKQGMKELEASMTNLERFLN